MDDTDRTYASAVYDQVCQSYHAVDDFRMKLLGLLPVATGASVFVLLSGREDALGKGDDGAGGALLAIGIFGFLFSLGLFAYELFGIKKCHYLIAAGARLEHDLGVHGQFRSRPRAIAGRINEPFASAVIYPASMAAWVFLGLAVRSEWAAGAAAILVFAAGFLLTTEGAKRIKLNEEREDLVRSVVGEGRALADVRDDATRRWAAHSGAADHDDGGPKWVDEAVERLVSEGELRRIHFDGDERLEPSTGDRWEQRGPAGAAPV